MGMKVIFVDLEFPLCGEAAVPPEKVQLVEGCSGLTYPCDKVCVGGTVLSDEDPKVSDLCFDFDCELFLALSPLLWGGLWWQRVGVFEFDICVSIRSDQFTFAQVEFEVVLCSCGLYVVEGSLHSV